VLLICINTFIMKKINSKLIIQRTSTIERRQNRTWKYNEHINLTRSDIQSWLQNPTGAFSILRGLSRLCYIRNCAVIVTPLARSNEGTRELTSSMMKLSARIHMRCTTLPPMPFPSAAVIKFGASPSVKEKN